MDFRVIGKDYRYGVRVSAIILKDSNVLTYKVDGENHLVGGAMEVGEASADAVAREVKEELGLDCVVQDIMFIVENRFDYKGEMHHMIEFHYKVEILGDIPNRTTDEHSFELEWLPLESLSKYDVRPKFLIHELPNWNGNVQHIDSAL